ncbi:protein TAPETUM DETERMINANT 1-like [Fagus crenata]
MSSCHVFFPLLILLIILFCSLGIHLASSNEFIHSSHEDNNHSRTVNLMSKQAYSSCRTLLLHGTCTNRDISISQSRGSTSGIPQYIVQIVNTCVSGCAPSDIHLHCGWFASAGIINPRTFKRLSYDDCLVNGGKPLKTSQIIRFTYSNSFMYPLAFKSAKFC